MWQTITSILFSKTNIKLLLFFFNEIKGKYELAWTVDSISIVIQMISQFYVDLFNHCSSNLNKYN